MLAAHSMAPRIPRHCVDPRIGERDRSALARHNVQVQAAPAASQLVPE
jgi:hypothetical protein